MRFTIAILKFKIAPAIVPRARRPNRNKLGPPYVRLGGNGTRSFDWCQAHSLKISRWRVIRGLRSEFAYFLKAIPTVSREINKKLYITHL